MYESLQQDYCTQRLKHAFKNYKSINLCLLSKYVQIASSAWHRVTFLNK